MSGDLRVFVNERPYALPGGSTVGDALRLAAPDLLPLVADGAAFVTDGCGLEIGLEVPLTGGAILRAQRASRRA